MAGEDPSLNYRISVETDTRAVDATEAAIDRVVKKTGEATTATARTTEATGKATEGNRNLNRSLGDTSSGVSGAAASFDVLTRAANGTNVGITGVASGLAGLFQTLRLGVSPLTLLAGVVGAVGLAFLRMRRQADEAGMAKIFKDANDRRAELEAGLKSLEKTSATALQAQQQQVDRLKSSYDELLAAIDAFNQRTAAQFGAEQDLARAQLNLEEQQALAKAGTEEQRAAVSTTFAGRRQAQEDQFTRAGFENRLLEADVRDVNARSTIDRATGQRYGVQSSLRDVRSQIQTARDDGVSPESLQGLQAQEAKLVAELGRLAQVVAQASNQIEASRNTRALVATEQQTFLTGRQADTVPEEASLRRQIDAASAAGDYTTVDRLLAQRRQLGQTAGAYGAAVAPTRAPLDRPAAPAPALTIHDPIRTEETLRANTRSQEDVAGAMLRHTEASTRRNRQLADQIADQRP